MFLRPRARSGRPAARAVNRFARRACQPSRERGPDAGRPPQDARTGRSGSMLISSADLQPMPSEQRFMALDLGMPILVVDYETMVGIIRNLLK